MSEITLPYRFIPRDYQLKFLKAWDSGIKRMFIVWHRRSGKDKTVIANLSKKMMERVGTYFYALPTYSQAKKIIWTGADKDGFKFLDHFPKELVKSVNQQDMVIELVNGSILQLIGADNIDRIVGTNPIGVVFSEYSLMKPDVWNLISPILLENGGWAVFIMTPRGTNHAWDLMQKIKHDPSWFLQVLTVDNTKALSKEQLEQAQKEMPQDLFKQEYYCAFLDNGLGFFRRVDENTYKIDEYQPKELAFYQIGVDLAKYNDFTVISPFNLQDFHLLKQDSFNQMDYNLQKARIENAYLKHNKGRIVIDSTGVGEPVFDDLNARGMNIMPFRFNRTSRTDLLKNLQILLEQDKIKIPNDEVLIDELKSMTYELNETGGTKITVPDGKHDDRIMSLALSVWEIPLNPIHINAYTNAFQTKGVDSFYPEFGGTF
jgi:Terminase RNaseH-like domain/Terminase large subunit, T4likevirus-type, N-terminal